MPGLTGVGLWDVHLTGELDVKQVTMSESLKKFVMIRKLPDRVCNVDVTQLVSIIGCMPGLTEVGLWHVHLIGGLDVKQRTLSESLKGFVMAGHLPNRVYNVNVTLLANFLSCMPALTRVELQDVHLTGELDYKMVEIVSLQKAQVTGELESNCVTMSESVKSLCVVSTKINVKLLVYFLSCMPSPEQVGLIDAELTGNLDGNPVILSESLHRVYMRSRSPEKSLNVNITQLCSIFSCMPSLTQVKLRNVQLTGEMRDSSITLSEALKEVCISGCNKDCPGYCCGEWCVNGVKEEKEKEKENVEETEGDEKKKDELVDKKKDMADYDSHHSHQCTINIHTLVGFLRCMQSHISLKLNRVAVLGMLDEGTSTVLPVQEFSCVDCFSSPQLLSIILAQGNAVRALQLSGFRSQFTEDDVRRIFTTGRLASLKVLNWMIPCQRASVAHNFT